MQNPGVGQGSGDRTGGGSNFGRSGVSEHSSSGGAGGGLHSRDRRGVNPYASQLHWPAVLSSAGVAVFLALAVFFTQRALTQQVFGASAGDQPVLGGAELSQLGDSAWGVWAAAFTCAVLAGLSDGLRVRLQAKDALVGESKYRSQLVSDLFTLGGARVKAHPSGRLVSLAMEGAEKVAESRDSFRSELIGSGVQVAILLAGIAWIVDPFIALGLIGGLVLAALSIRLFMKLRHKSMGANRKARSAVAAAYLEAIQSLETLALLRATKRVASRLEAAGEAQRKETMSILARNQRLLFIIDLTIFGVFMGVTALSLALSLGAGRIGTLSVVSTIVLVVFLIEPIDLVGSFFYIVFAARGFHRSMEAIHRTATEVQSRQVSELADVGSVAGVGSVSDVGSVAGVGSVSGAGGAPGAEAETSRRTLEDLSGAPALHVRNLSYAYDSSARTRTARSDGRKGANPLVSGRNRDSERTDRRKSVGSSGSQEAAYANSVEPTRDKPVLDDLTFDIEAGTLVAITGPSGTGKSTLLSVLAGQLPLQKGSIQIGTHKFDAKRNQIDTGLSAFIAQDTWLLSGTVRNNLLMGNRQAGEDEIWQALADAQVAEEIRRLPEGLDTGIGERGGLLSGGQIQRLALARAYLSGRKLIIADEPTAHVDMDSQERIMRSLLAARGRCTIVLVTHRPGVAALADRVLELADLSAPTSSKAGKR